MSSTRSTIELIISGSLQGLTGAVGAAKAELDALKQRTDGMEKAGEAATAALTGLAKSMLGITAVSGVIQVIGGVIAALQQLVPIVLLAPAGLLSMVAAFATLKLGMANFFDAFKPGSAGDKAFAKLSANAKETVTALKSMAPAFHEVQQAVQNSLFDGLATQLKAIGGTYLPILRAQLPQIASGFNAMAKSLDAALGKKITQYSITDVLSNTAKAIDNARNALGAFAFGFIGLADNGSAYLPRIGTAIDGLAQRFQAFTTRITTDGSFETFVDRAIAGFKDLFAVVGDVGRSIVSLFQGLAGPQGDVLASLRATTDALAAFLSEASTQTALGSFGAALRAVADATRNVLLEALKQLVPIIQDLTPFAIELATVFGERLVNALKIVGPILDGVAKFLSANKAIADVLIPVLGYVAARFALLKVGTAVIEGIKALNLALSGLGGLLKVGAWATLAVIADDINNINLAAAGGDPKKLGFMAGELNDLVGAGKELASGDIPGILSQISSQIDAGNQKWAAGQAPIQQWFDKVKTSFQTDFVGALRSGSTAMDNFFAGIRDKVSGSFQKDFLDVFAGLPAKIGGYFSGVGTTISTAVGTWFGGVKDSFQHNFLDVFANLPSDLGSEFSSLGSTIATLAETAWSNLVRGAKDQIAITLSELAHLPYDVGYIIGSLGGIIASAAIAAWSFLSRGAKEQIDIAVAQVKALPDQVGGALAALGSFLATAAGAAWHFLVTGAQTQIALAISQAQALPGQIGAALASLGNFLGTLATNAWEFFLHGAQTNIANTVGEAQQVPGKVGGAMSSLGSTLLTIATDAWNGFLAFSRKSISDAIAAVVAVPAAIGSALASLAGVLLNAAVSAWQGFLRGAQTEISNAIAQARALPGQILSALGNVGNLLVGAGRAIIDGLTAGIRAGYNAMIQFVSGIAAGIAAHKGPLSYDKVLLRPAGLAIMGGLLDSLKDGHKDVLAFTDTIADSIAASATGGGLIATARAFDAGTARASAPGLSASPTTLPVTIPISIGDEVVRVVNTQIDLSNRAVARTVNAGSGVGAG